MELVEGEAAAPDRGVGAQVQGRCRRSHAPPTWWSPPSPGLSCSGCSPESAGSSATRCRSVNGRTSRYRRIGRGSPPPRGGWSPPFHSAPCCWCAAPTATSGFAGGSGRCGTWRPSGHVGSTRGPHPLTPTGRSRSWRSGFVLPPRTESGCCSLGTARARCWLRRRSPPWRTPSSSRCVLVTHGSPLATFYRPYFAIAFDPGWASSLLGQDGRRRGAPGLAQLLPRDRPHSRRRLHRRRRAGRQRLSTATIGSPTRGAGGTIRVSLFRRSRCTRITSWSPESGSGRRAFSRCWPTRRRLMPSPRSPRVRSMAGIRRSEPIDTPASCGPIVPPGSGEHRGLAAVLEAGRWTGSSKNDQAWAVVVVDDPERRKELAAAGRYADPIVTAPVAVALVRLPGGNDFDQGRLAQNLMLAAAGRGLGSCPVTLHDDATAAKVLGLPSGHRVRWAIAIGHPDRDDPPVRRRRPQAAVGFRLLRRFRPSLAARLRPTQGWQLPRRYSPAQGWQLCGGQRGDRRPARLPVSGRMPRMARTRPQ